MASGKKKRKAISWKLQIMMIFTVLAALAAMPTTVLLFFGLLPTAVALFIDRTDEKTRVLTVGAMNAAGCTPFIMQLWTTNHTLENAFMIISDPRTVIVMYCAAGVGYIIDWTVSGLVGTFMVSRANVRREQIARRQEDLVERWGREVTGEIPVDAAGFPIDNEENIAKDQKAAGAAGA